MTHSDMSVLARLLALFRPYRRWMIFGMLTSTVTILASVGLMAAAGGFLAAMAIAGLAGVLMNYFLPAAAIRLFAVLRTGGRYTERVVSHEATFRLLARLRVWLFRRLAPLSASQLQVHRGADLASRLQADIDVLQHAYLRLFSPVVAAAIGTVVVVGVLALFSVQAALLVLVLLLIAGVAVPELVRRLNSQPSADIVHSKATLRVAVVDALQGMTDLRVQGTVERKAQEIASHGEVLCDHQLRVARFGSLSEHAVGLCASLALWGVALIAIAGVAGGSLVPMQIPLLALAALASFELVMPLPLVMQRIGEIVAAARRIFAVADEEPSIASPTQPSPAPSDASISLRGVRLRYDNAPAWALDDVSLYIASGGRLGIIGSSGAGKSSLARVLLRLWEYQEGEIRLGGHDLRRYRLEDVRSLIGVVSQDTQLFNATIRNNLRFARPDADDGDMERAMRIAQLHEFVTGLSDGYDTWIGEAGMRLSVGQARRLAIARVILRDPSILILDEATEGLDATTAQALMAALSDWIGERTLLLITHNPEEARGLVQEFVRIEGGRIV
jgi:ATP-binding cassette subfamily C protein CydC